MTYSASDDQANKVYQAIIDDRFEALYDKRAENAIEEMACWLAPDGIGWEHEEDFYNMVAAIKADIREHNPTELSARIRAIIERQTDAMHPYDMGIEYARITG